MQPKYLNFLPLSFWFIFTFFSIANSYGQTTTFSGTEITSFTENDFSPVFERFNIYELNSTAFDGFVKGDNYDSQVRLNFGNIFDWDMTLFEHDIRGERYILRTATENGIQEVPKGDVITFRGYLNNFPDSHVRLTIDGDFIYGFIQQGKLINFIEPANRFSESSADNHYIIYNAFDVREDAGKQCGVTDTKNSSGLATPDQNNTDRSALACQRLELAIASDYSYMVARGGNIGDATAAALGVMNNVEGDYTGSFNDNIEFEIVEQFVSTCELCDPWTTSVEAGTLLSDFMAWGNNSGFSNGTGYDLAQLWTARDICSGTNCSTVGLAYVGVVCHSFRYHILEDFSTNATDLRVLTSHEIGHNFNLGHDASSGFIMSPSVNSTTTWSSTSISGFNAFTSGLTCLDACGAVACDPISNLQIQLTNTTSPQINVSWTGTAAGNYTIRVREEGANVDIFTQNTSSTNVNILPPIESCKRYEIIVEADCGGSTSNPTIGFIINLGVTSPNGGETWTAGTNETVRWFVSTGGTDCNIVDVLLSLDGGNSFPITLADDITNDGNEVLSIPSGISNTTNARIKVVCANTCTTYEDVSDDDFTISSSCMAQASALCPTETITATEGNSALNLNVANNLVGLNIINSKVITVTGNQGASPTNTNGDCSFASFNFSHGFFTFQVSQAGNYNISGNEVGFYSLFQTDSYVYNSSNPCGAFNFVTASRDATSLGSNSMTATLEECTDYTVVAGRGGNGTVTISISGSGDAIEATGIAGGNGYTFIAINQSTNTVSAQSPTANFTTLPGNGGTTYEVYGVSYDNAETPSSWVGLSESVLLDGTRCLLLSNNNSTLTVTGGTSCPTASVISGNATICSGESTNISVAITGGASPYTVVYNNGSSNIMVNSYNSGDNISVSPTSTTTYTLVSVTDANGCVGTGNSGSAVITVNDGSSAATMSGTATITSGNSTPISVAITGGSSPYTLEYSDGSNNTTINSYTSGTAISVSPTSNTTYSIVSITDSNGCVGTGNTGSAIITVNTPSSCPSTLNVTAVAHNQTYQAANTITSSVVIPSTNTVTFLAGQSITLGVGFSASPTSTHTFTAAIANCTPFQAPAVTRNNINNLDEPTDLSLSPNPASDFVTIDYQLGKETTAQIELYDATGRRLAAILPLQSQAKGKYQQQFNLGNLQEGMYFILLQTETAQISKTLILVR